MAAPAVARRELHHRVPRCLLKSYDRAQGSGLEPQDLFCICMLCITLVL